MAPGNNHSNNSNKIKILHKLVITIQKKNNYEKSLGQVLNVQVLDHFDFLINMLAFGGAINLWPLAMACHISARLLSSSHKSHIHYLEWNRSLLEVMFVCDRAMRGTVGLLPSLGRPDAPVSGDHWRRGPWEAVICALGQRRQDSVTLISEEEFVVPLEGFRGSANLLKWGGASQDGDGQTQCFIWQGHGKIRYW